MKTELDRALRAWLLVRTGLATVVLGLALTVFVPGDETIGFTSSVLVGAVTLILVSSFAVAGTLMRGASQVRAASALLVFDIVEVTAAMGVTGGAGSVFTVLFGAVIVAAATTLGARAAFIAGGLALASYSAVGLGLASGAIPVPSDQAAAQYRLGPQDLVFAVLSNVTAMLIVTLLSSWLATQLRRAGGALAESEESRRRLGELNESIVRSLGSGLLTLDAARIVTSVNPAGEELLGADAQSIIGASVHDFFPELEPPTGRHHARAETRARRGGDDDFPAGYSVAALESAHPDEAGGMLVSFQDLTEFKQLERAARDAERLATLGRVAATLAHEIRNPLSSISGSVELVREGATLDDENENLLKLVIREVERLDELVEAMLDVARPRIPRFDTVDLGVLVADVCTMASAGLGAEVRVVDFGAAPCIAVLDADMMRQVTWNLVKNAVQSAGPTAGVVEVARGSIAGTDGTFVEVRDRGPGIPSGDEERIFDAFHTGRTRGVGLGLALVKQLVDAHDGVITARSRTGGGAVFRVELPHRVPDARDSSPRARRSPIPAAIQE